MLLSFHAVWLWAASIRYPASGRYPFDGDTRASQFEQRKTGIAQRDEDDCSAVIADDEEVDLLVKQADRSGTNILIRFPPLATDFRTVIASIKLGSHLENISDQAVIGSPRGVCEVTDLEPYVKRSLVPAGDFKDLHRKVAQPGKIS